MFFNFFKKDTSFEPEHKREQIQDYDDISQIANFFKNETGVTFDKQESILKNKVTTFCKHKEIFSFHELLDSLNRNSTLKQELIDTLTTNETFFYREFKQVQELVELVKKCSHKVEILCAPSATGEEPYSIAIALLEAGVASESFNILGIDINQEAIQRAKNGVYKERNIRNLSSEQLRKYFKQEGGLYRLNDSVKSRVTFRVINIFDHSFKNIGNFDFIFCRNMLIYFDKETKIKAKEILQNLRKNKNQEIFFGHADLF
ncbi:MCP methyltransferase, CheR-type [Sulfurimonas denitrificans DSM 1251]|uniref:MCP methyltransferase, CheR-type n=1 Tax=Sulfurimonas denitrificans (strain ATCC 33889 / DSM 1251) TaxID=326298 RepID=Q30P67_SULDN|nr:protein-glutamate O-methyltransferase CheR [Sulfurimonas denitrificans]ABB45214.1 MCP methyltransferase, CheR-type [Sulfurimonas denitrificans DSM 1251]MDD3443552.1 protein-glutamate O-methyltransferase CheR [Sulfurimonas denitrificans]